MRVTLRGLGGHAVTIPLPPVHLTDIGKESGGVSPREAVIRVFSAVGEAVVAAVKGSGRLIGDGAEALGSGAKAIGTGVADGAAKTVESIGGLLRRDE